MPITVVATVPASGMVVRSCHRSESPTLLGRDPSQPRSGGRSVGIKQAPVQSVDCAVVFTVSEQVASARRGFVTRAARCTREREGRVGHVGHTRANARVAWGTWVTHAHARMHAQSSQSSTSMCTRRVSRGELHTAWLTRLGSHGSAHKPTCNDSTAQSSLHP
jgi:hypothetical protein